MHPVDSILNPYFDPNSGAYYFGHRSVNRSLGAQLGNQLSGTISGVPVWVRFHGFPSYDQVRPIAPRGPF